MRKQALRAAVICAAIAVASAGPAWADDPPTDDIYVLEGEYTYSDANTTRSWHATPCGSCCADIEAPPVGGMPGFSGQAQNFRGWTLTLENVPDLVACRDGSSAAGNINYRWRPGETNGSGSTWTTVQTCGEPPKAYETFDFTLTKVS